MKYTLNINDDDGVDEMTPEQYDELCLDAETVLESPAEYGDYIFILPAKNDRGQDVFLGFR